MTELSLQPLLLLHVPPCHEVDPQALADLLELVSEGYGASVLVNPAQAVRSCLHHCSSDAGATGILEISFWNFSPPSTGCFSTSTGLPV
ncbi:hypothetical protein ACFSC4_26220 [Deinococcus malanensis]|uniref:hypothetical protein n=1 Tax=Deinococcus malanensis TaxID=1706855 RepID=UPI003632B40A